MQFEVVSGSVTIADALDSNQHKLQVSVGMWNAQTVELYGHVTQLFVYHHKYQGATVEEFKLNWKVNVVNQKCGVFDEIDYYPTNDEWVHKNIDSSSSILNVLERGVYVCVPNGEYEVFATVDRRGMINSLRIVFFE